MKIPSTARVILQTMQEHATDGRFVGTHESIGHLSEINPRTVPRNLKALKDAKLIKLARKGRGAGLSKEKSISSIWKLL